MRKLRPVLLSFLVLATLSAAVAWQADPPVTDPEPLPTVAPGGPRYWKGNLHTHSLWSDGDDFPEMIADWYRRHGYHFLTLSDHNVLSEGQRWVGTKGNEVALEKYRRRFGGGWVEQRTENGQGQVRLKPLSEFRSVLEVPGRFLLIQGEEITHRFARSPVHMNGINLRDVVTPIDGNSVAETIQVNHRSVLSQEKATGRPMVTFLNHPNFGWGVKAEDMVQAEDLQFFEVYNGHPGVRNYGDEDHPGTERLWDIVLALRLGKYKLPAVYGMATDDAHRYHKYGVGEVNPGRGWVMVRAPFLTAETIVNAIKSGDFYLSTGVTLDEVRRQGPAYSLKIRGEPGVQYTTQFVATLRGTPLDSTARGQNGKPLDVTRIYGDKVGEVVAESDSLTPGYRLTGNELYVRAKVISTKPHPNPYAKGDVEVAWTQPVLP